jgi:hypothetical protein
MARRRPHGLHLLSSVFDSRLLHSLATHSDLNQLMWAQLINLAIGIWLMAAPAVLPGSVKAAEVNDRIVGPLAATFACVAIWEVTRGCRWVNLPLGLWLLISPMALGLSGYDAANSVLCGIALAGLACIGGPVRGRFGGGWSSLWKTEACP